MFSFGGIKVYFLFIKTHWESYGLIHMGKKMGRERKMTGLQCARIVKGVGSLGTLYKYKEHSQEERNV